MAQDMRTFKNSLSDQISSLHKGLDDRTDEKVINTKIRAMGESIQDAFEKRTYSLERMVKERDENVTKAEIHMEKLINELQDKFSDMEVNTKWKIRDCEELLKIRVSDKFVWETIA